ncbi:MAG: hypothetical protein QM647_08865 [Asticcacaulis sp.]|uniref:hypothetical protein n=1 Tax=Asticcacaulis sp. TaxID=1872648 RepID=UPI0039E4C132
MADSSGMISREDFEARQARQRVDQNRLLTMLTFSTEDEALKAAWRKDATGSIGQLLETGNRLNRESWQAAIDIFNAAKADIDLSRHVLHRQAAEVEQALAPYAIDMDGMAVEISGTLEGDMVYRQLPPKDIWQTLEYSRGAGNALARAATGNGSWQVALAVAVFSGVMMLANHQRDLRHLKELEGQIAVQAEAVRGDIKFIDTELFQRMRPQFNRLVALMADLRDGLAGLRQVEADDGDGREAALYLARHYREASYLLQMKAGN